MTQKTFPPQKMMMLDDSMTSFWFSNGSSLKKKDHDQSTKAYKVETLVAQARQELKQKTAAT